MGCLSPERFRCGSLISMLALKEYVTLLGFLLAKVNPESCWNLSGGLKHTQTSEYVSPYDKWQNVVFRAPLVPLLCQAAIGGH